MSVVKEKITEAWDIFSKRGFCTSAYQVKMQTVSWVEPKKMKSTGFLRNSSKRKKFNVNENLLIKFIISAGCHLAQTSARVNQNVAQQSI